jgi:serine/threonine-protein kinase 11
MDIWASGVTLYNLVSGTYPFEGDVIMKLFDNIAKNPLKMPEGMEFSEELVELLHGLLDKNPNKRWNISRIKASKWITKEHKTVS